MRPVHVLIMGLLGLTAACGSAPPASTYGSRDKNGGKDDGNDPASGDGLFGDEAETPPATSATPPGASEVWSHSYDTLYRLDPITKQVTVIGRFNGCDGDVLDIALDAQSNLFATTDTALHRVDRKTAACTVISRGLFPNSLSFVPKGTVDPNAEALVGYQPDNSYVRIDTKTGAVTRIGSLGNVPFRSSGDIVSVTNGPTYLTVYGEGSGCADCLVEVNPKTGAMTKNWGPLVHDEVFGVAFWAGSVYGFSAAGALFELTFAGGKLATKNIPLPSTGVDVQFFGAGSTTSAPVTPTR